MKKEKRPPDLLVKNKTAKKGGGRPNPDVWRREGLLPERLFVTKKSLTPSGGREGGGAPRKRAFHFFKERKGRQPGSGRGGKSAERWKGGKIPRPKKPPTRHPSSSQKVPHFSQKSLFGNRKREKSGGKGGGGTYGTHVRLKKGSSALGKSVKEREEE